jgi:hypothetical protein
MCDLSVGNLFAIVIFRSLFYAELVHTVCCFDHFSFSVHTFQFAYVCSDLAVTEVLRVS